MPEFDIEALRERVRRENYAEDAWRTQGYGEVLRDAELLIDEVARLTKVADLADQNTWACNEDRERLVAENARLREVLKTIEHCGTHKMDRETARAALGEM